MAKVCATGCNFVNTLTHILENFPPRETKMKLHTFGIFLFATKETIESEFTDLGKKTKALETQKLPFLHST